MAEKEVIIKEQVKYVGLLILKDLYNYLYDWLRDEKYIITEEKYTEKIRDDGKDVEIIWSATKEVTDYYKYEITLRWRIFRLKDVEVEIDGKKKKMEKVVELGISLRGTLIKDYKSKWESNAFAKFFRDVYNKYVIPGRTEKMEILLIKDVQDLNGEIKAFLELTGKRPEREL